MYYPSLIIVMVQYELMEFEKNIPATAEEIALADAPKLTLQPNNADIAPEPLNSNHSHLNEATFAFESEKTDPASNATPQVNHSHLTATLVAIGCAVLFSGALAAALFLR